VPTRLPGAPRVSIHHVGVGRQQDVAEPLPSKSGRYYFLPFLLFLLFLLFLATRITSLSGLDEDHHVNDLLTRRSTYH
jgi:hypothetical protein